MKHLSTIIALAATLGASSATAAGITIQGAVSTSATITVSPAAPYNVLDLGTDQTDLKVASVNEKCNKHNGYTVTLASAKAESNGGGTVAKLVGAPSFLPMICRMDFTGGLRWRISRSN